MWNIFICHLTLPSYYHKKTYWVWLLVQGDYPFQLIDFLRMWNGCSKLERHRVLQQRIQKLGCVQYRTNSWDQCQGHYQRHFTALIFITGSLRGTAYVRHALVSTISSCNIQCHVKSQSHILSGGFLDFDLESKTGKIVSQIFSRGCGVVVLTLISPFMPSKGVCSKHQQPPPPPTLCVSGDLNFPNKDKTRRETNHPPIQFFWQTAKGRRTFHFDILPYQQYSMK